MHEEFSGMAGMTAVEQQSAHAATLCTWVAQEHRTQEVLKGPELAGVADIVPALDRFLASRSNKLTVAHWVGIDILLQGVDMAQNLMAPHISARILRMIAGYQPKGADQRSIESFVTREPSAPMVQGLFHREELIRYWSAIAVARTNETLSTPHAGLVIDLLQQAIDEVVTPSILMVSQPSVDAEQVHKKLQDMGYLVKRVDDPFDALDSLRSFPSKDFIVLDPDFEAGSRGVQFVNKIRKDVKGKDLPLVILSDEQRSGKHFITFQEEAQQLIMGSDSIDTLRGKLRGLRQQKHTVHGPDMALGCSREALNALMFLEETTLRRFPSLTEHLSDLLVAKHQPIPSQIMAIRSLRKLGPVAADSANMLLEKMDESQYDVAYKIVVLHALLAVSGPNEDVRKKLFNVITSSDSPDKFKQMAASYLSNEFENLSEEEKVSFQNSFFSDALLPDSGS
jgi:CheY-like chemotaxis protein